MDKLTVLHVEDDLDAAFFLKRAFEKSSLNVDLRQLRNGEEAIRYLAGSIPYEDRAAHPLPAVILLDLKMPLKDGFEVLTWIKQMEALKEIPVIILTSSDREEDLRRAKSLGASFYLTKTVTFGNVVKTVEEITQGPAA